MTCKAKQLTVLLAALLISFSAVAGSTNDVSDDTVELQDPKQCLTELQVDKDAQADQKEEEKKKDEPSWFDKLVKQHKLGSLHFQDLIELFH